VGDTGRPRFGCNASIRKELIGCNPGTQQNPTPSCWINTAGIPYERRFNLADGTWMNENVFAALQAKCVWHHACRFGDQGSGPWLTARGLIIIIIILLGPLLTQ
jgi:hypothetical protein